MKKIVIIEDDPMIGKVLDLKLQNEAKEKGIEMQILRAKNGEEGIKLICDENPDMVITDMMMPVKSGFDMLEELKTKGCTHDMRIIALSNLSETADIERATNLGVNEYFIKNNTSINKITERIIDQLENSRPVVGAGL